jgi:hypothetical protein
LTGEFDGEAAGARPDTDVWLSVNERCRVVIGVSKNGWGQELWIFNFITLSSTKVSKLLENLCVSIYLSASLGFNRHTL